MKKILYILFTISLLMPVAVNNSQEVASQTVVTSTHDYVSTNGEIEDDLGTLD
ncbi:hypothetical protein [Alkalibacillus aidingensis]|uniref:hypothetical protein n=1 Tax=Alkalibacillus aidingensis TaxID=2747607 RepID=UPI001660EA06|nr:hypothetical protein [Alkalibacillus aidingensis]